MTWTPEDRARAERARRIRDKGTITNASCCGPVVIVLVLLVVGLLAHACGVTP